MSTETVNAPAVDQKRLVRAFRVDVSGWPEATCIVLTTSAAKAKFTLWNSAKGAGYDIQFGELRARRAPEFDGKSALLPRRCYSVEYAASSPNKPDHLQNSADIPPEEQKTT